MPRFFSQIIKNNSNNIRTSERTIPNKYKGIKLANTAIYTAKPNPIIGIGKMKDKNDAIDCLITSSSLSQLIFGNFKLIIKPRVIEKSDAVKGMIKNSQKLVQVRNDNINGNETTIIIVVKIKLVNIFALKIVNSLIGLPFKIHIFLPSKEMEDPVITNEDASKVKIIKSIVSVETPGIN